MISPLELAGIKRGKVGAGFAGQRVDPGVSVTPSRSYSPFVESLAAKGIVGAGRGISGAWGGAV